MDAPTSAKAALLQELTRGSGHGLDLIERVRAVTDGGLDLGQGSVYPALRELEADGLVEAVGGKRPDGERPRKRYRLTARGRQHAAEQRATVAGAFGLEER
jgi:DNA-binding PadR family transcriptional regulator